MHKFIFIFSIVLLSSIWSYGQEATSTSSEAYNTSGYDQERLEVFEILRQKDSLLFKLGYNNCDTATLRTLISDDFEFYHDQAGIVNSKDFFIKGISGLCHMSYKATRELNKNSLEVHLLKNNGKLYGAIQRGEHAFYGEEEDKPKYLTSTAKFTHLWILQEGSWVVKRVLSYDHASPKN